MARRTIFCNHYRAMSDHATCKAGIEYEHFKGVPFDKRPCFCRNGGKPPGGCDLAEFPTAEQVAKEDEEFRQKIMKVRDARLAIVAHLGGAWKKGMAGSAGKIDCPVCYGKQTLRFSRAGVNGHIHAHCSTDGCVSWME